MNTKISFDADKLRALRLDQGITKTELGCRADLSDGHVCRLENGQIPLPNIEIVWKLADYFKIDMNEFIKK